MRFIQSLLSRHLDRDTNVKPRVRGRFEDEPVRMPNAKEENPNRVATENGIQEFDERSNQEHAQNFWMPRELRKGTPRKSQKQADAAPSLFARSAMSRTHEGFDEQPVHAEKVVSSKPQPPQDAPVTSKNNSLTTDDSRDIGQIRYNPKVHLATSSNELDNVTDGSKSKDGTNDIPVSTHHLSWNDGAAEQNEKPAANAASPGIISPRRKGVMNTLGLSSIHSPSKPPEKRVVNVSIGRVEIRASFPSSEVRIPAPEEGTERITLDQYLNQQKSVNR